MRQLNVLTILSTLALLSGCAQPASTAGQTASSTAPAVHRHRDDPSIGSLFSGAPDNDAAANGGVDASMRAGQHGQGAN